MNIRRILYAAFIAFIALFLYNSLQNKETLDNLQMQPISRQSILNSIDSPQFEFYQKIDYVYFPFDYEGKAGEVFYISVEKNDNGSTSYKYRIKEMEQGDSLEYILEQTWDGVEIPAEKFDTYHLEDGEWVKI